MSVFEDAVQGMRNLPGPPHGNVRGFRNREEADAERPRVKSSAVFTYWEFPTDIGDSPGTMVNIEDFIERRGI